MAPIVSRFSVPLTIVNGQPKILEEPNQTDRKNPPSAKTQTIFSPELSEQSIKNSRVPYTKISGPISSNGGPLFVGNQSAQGNIINNFASSTRTRLLRWLSTVPYPSHHRAMAYDLLENSGTWLFSHVKFQNWLEPLHSSVLWLHGIPGSGKTKLVATLIDKLLPGNLKSFSNIKGNGDEELPRVAYFYISKSNEREYSDPDYIMSTLLKQVAISPIKHTIADVVQKDWEQRLAEAEQIGLEAEIPRLKLCESVSLFLKLLEEIPMIMVIDALDECDVHRRHELLAALDDLIQKARCSIRIFVSSRNDNDIDCRLSISPNIAIDVRQNRGDIARYVKREVQRAIESKQLLSGNVSEDLENFLVYTLTERARTMFKWASLQLQTLCDPRQIKHETDVRAELGRVPKELGDFYKQTYVGIKQLRPTSRQIAMRTLQWLLWSHRALSPQELCSAISYGANQQSLSVTPQAILDVCSNLVILDYELDSFAFAHLSVREYLEGLTEISQQRSNLMILDCCLNIYAMTISKPYLRLLPEDHPGAELAMYAARYWPTHLKELAPGQEGTDFKSSAASVVSALLEGTTMSPNILQAQQSKSLPSYASLPKSTEITSLKLSNKICSTFLTRNAFSRLPTSEIYVRRPGNYIYDPQEASSKLVAPSHHATFYNCLSESILPHLMKPMQPFRRPIGLRTDSTLSPYIFSMSEEWYYQEVLEILVAGYPTFIWNKVNAPISRGGIALLASIATLEIRLPHQRSKTEGLLHFNYFPGEFIHFMNCLQVLCRKDLISFETLLQSCGLYQPSSSSWFAEAMEESTYGLNSCLSNMKPSNAVSYLKKAFQRIRSTLLELVRLFYEHPNADFQQEILNPLSELGISSASINPSPKLEWVCRSMGYEALLPSLGYSDSKLTSGTMIKTLLVNDIRHIWNCLNAQEPCDGDGRTPLSHAAELGNLKDLWLQLNSHPDEFGQCDFIGRSPLSHAAAAGRDRVVKTLLQLSTPQYRYSQASCPDACGRTPMWWALAGGHESTVMILFDSRDVSKSDQKLALKYARRWIQRDRLRRHLQPIHHHSFWNKYLISPTLKRSVHPIRLPSETLKHGSKI